MKQNPKFGEHNLDSSMAKKLAAMFIAADAKGPVLPSGVVKTVVKGPVEHALVLGNDRSFSYEEGMGVN